MTEFDKKNDDDADLVHPAAENPAQIRLSAMNLLARREHSRRELTDKLGRRFGKAAIEPVLDRLEADRLVSDERFAEMFVRQRAGRGQGPLRIRQELRLRGIEEALVTRAFEANDINWLQVLGDLVERKYGDSPAEDPREKAKRMRFLASRGFSGEQIREVL